jgi:hypothetical protein
MNAYTMSARVLCRVAVVALCTSGAVAHSAWRKIEHNAADGGFDLYIDPTAGVFNLDTNRVRVKRMFSYDHLHEGYRSAVDLVDFDCERDGRWLRQTTLFSGPRGTGRVVGKTHDYEFDDDRLFRPRNLLSPGEAEMHDLWCAALRIKGGASR